MSARTDKTGGAEGMPAASFHPILFHADGVDFNVIFPSLFFLREITRTLIAIKQAIFFLKKN